MNSISEITADHAGSSALLENAGQGRRFRLKDFEGPLDLLLFLIKRNDMNIYDIHIASITEQYLDCLKNEEGVDLDELSEFYNLAATLLLVAGYLVWVARPSVRSAVGWGVGVVVGVLLVGISRLYLGYHFVTDVVASMALAVAVLGGVVVLDRRRAARAARVRPG